MDQFEAPNQRGAKPLVMRSFETATVVRRARQAVRAEQEWEPRVRGAPSGVPSPTAGVDKAVCNSERKAWQAGRRGGLGASGEAAQREVEQPGGSAPSGSHPGAPRPSASST